jgi:hypothetical protein
MATGAVCGQGQLMIGRIDKFWVVSAIGTTKLHERQVEEIKEVLRFDC